MALLRFALLAILAAIPTPVSAQYHMLFPDKASVKPDETIAFTYQFGHPFKHQFFDTQKPVSVRVVGPDGKYSELTDSLEKTSIEAGEGKKVTGYKFKFTPPTRGDYTIAVASPDLKIDGEARPLRDVTKIVVHVLTQNGWSNRASASQNLVVEVTPLTRPYGIKAGTVFHIEVDDPSIGGKKPLEKIAIEVEKYNASPPKELPANEEITRTALTSRAGDSALTLTEPGWWAITAIRDHEDTRHRCTLWVLVEEKVPAK